MFERFLFNVIQNEIDTWTANPQLIRSYFQSAPRCLEESEVDSIVELFTETARPTVIHQMARKHPDPPFYSIILANETEVESALGDYVGAVVDAEGSEAQFEGAPVLGMISEQTYMIMVVTEHPDTTRYYYHLLKAFMMRGRRYLRDQGGALQIMFSGGDLAPDEKFLPAHLLVRQFTVKVQLEDTVIGTRDPNTFKSVFVHRDTETDGLPKPGRVTAVSDPSGLDQ